MPVLHPLYTVLLLIWTQVFNLRIEDDHEPIPGFCALRREILWEPRRTHKKDEPCRLFLPSVSVCLGLNQAEAPFQLESPSGAFTVK